MQNTPNWMHHSKKKLKGKGTCKGRVRAARQTLQAVKRGRLKNRHKGTHRGALSVFIIGYKQRRDNGISRSQGCTGKAASY